MKLRFKILFAGIFIVLSGCVLIWAWHARSKGALESYKRELRARGEKLAYRELLRATPPPEPEAAKAFMATNSIFVSISNTAPMMRFVAPGRALVSYQQETLPNYVSTNAWPLLIPELETNRTALLKLREILQGPALFFNPDYSRNIFLLLPHLSKLKAAEQLAAYSTIVALHGHNDPEAWTNLISSVALLHVYQTEPVLISQLVEIAMARIAMSATWEALQYDRWTEAQLSELQRHWQQVDLFEPAEQTLAMERDTSIDLFKFVRKSYDGQSGLFSTVEEDGSPAAVTNTVTGMIDRYPKFWAWKLAWSYQEELVMLKREQAAVEVCRATESTGAFVPALGDYDVKIAEINKQFAKVSANFLLPPIDAGYRTAIVKLVDAEVGRRLTVTAIALKRFQLRNGKHPAEVKNLVPEFLEKLPIDLMDGKPLRYQLKPEGAFVLYSVGVDGQDNGGDATPTEPATTKYKNWLRGRDVVWPQAATPEEIALSLTKTNDAIP